MPPAERTMNRRLGFTLVELAIALVIGTVLTTIALASWQGASSRFAVRGARNTFVTLVARTRAQAIENGSMVALGVSTSGDSVWITNGTTTYEVVHFMDDNHVDLRSSTGDFRLCMNSRGYGDTNCNSFSSAVTLQFWRGADSTSVEVLPLGQTVY
jgi:prepilin-type N-terminal cleavage/methylation domain-containing protein